MDRLWSKRFQSFIREIGKYSRLVLNDHFSIILLVLLAFGALYYRELFNYLSTIDPYSVRWVIILTTTLSLGFIFNIGQPIWLVFDPDKSYLFPRGRQWSRYWLKGMMCGMLLPSIILILWLILVHPFLILVTTWSQAQLVTLIGISLLYKFIQFMMIYLKIYQLGFSRWVSHSKLLVTIIYGFTFMLSSLIEANTWLLLAVAIMLSLWTWMEFQRSQQAWADFEFVVADEEHRTANFYKWMSVFADVPHLKPPVKRWPLFDSLLNTVPLFNHNRHTLLYSRQLVRNSAYSGIWIRVTIFMSILLTVTTNQWMLIAIGVLSHWMTLIQLYPLIQSERHHPIQRLYPERQSNAIRSFQQTMVILLIVQSLIYAIISLIVRNGTYIIWIAWLLSSVLMAYLYTQFRARKLAQSI